ncbi:hypothetical protein DBR42_07980 [Pelomonas sp. HMWF004]|nr:hypothetical protein DBR42_07980 [Pelomonas sp. HMWF004]
MLSAQFACALVQPLPDVEPSGRLKLPTPSPSLTMTHDDDNRRWLHGELVSKQSKIEDLDRQVEALAVAAQDLELREQRLQLSLEASSHPRTLYNERKPADIAIELGQVRAGIDELARFQRDVARTLSLTKDQQRSLQRDLDRLG